MKRVLSAAICAVLACLGGAAPAHAAFDDPLYFYTPQPKDARPVPPAGYLDGPCGLAVSSGGQVYVSDYYHRSVDVFTALPSYSAQPLTAWTGAANPHTGLVDDPCGLALDSTGTLYVDNYHRNVTRFPAPVLLDTAQVIDTGDPSDPYANPTGVAVDPTTHHVFVDDRTYLAEYDAAGTFVQRLGEGPLGDSYGIAVSGYAGTAGYLYVPDAGSDTVKVFDPSNSTTAPKATITGPPGGFGSLQDSAIAVNNSTGEIYVVDTLGPQLSEEPWAIVYVFSAAGTYKGRLKHATIDAAPVGLAVDNSGTSTQGRVYLTSGIGENAGLYGYPPGAATSAAQPPLGFGSTVGGTGSGVTSSSGGGLSTGSGSALALAQTAADPPRRGAARGSQVRTAARTRKRRRARHRWIEKRRLDHRHQAPPGLRPEIDRERRTERRR
jgi:hypothetical protein